MVINQQIYKVKGLQYIIRSAATTDADELSHLRVQLDGETENLDREPGEGYMNKGDFEELISRDTESKRNLFLVAVVHNEIVGFSRCEGNELKRFAHKVEFGVCVAKEFWGYGIGKGLLQQSILWADRAGIKKVTLNVLETNRKAVRLYEHLGFEVEGVLKNDKLLSDGKYYHMLVMGRFA
ncbi:GNAT family N-acetyltransferase [Priestia megaterium]|uniref:GNAT family N-acetyltransferase n=1 Tax=Priestia megaterium TaxID=1404 RepID=A0A3D8X1I9_PRIMG|nr:GNAT family N-acetyltransferase [Priestia megaterium]MDH3171118.1 GNAT family N-acetyltransferase [Priestia megaterium]RDZ13455.1 GNAT family N-acetyltransferase [Priestia megaterium]